MLKPTKVMIADDDPGIVDLLSLMLKSEGYDVSSTFNGATLLEINSELPDIILMDISMQGVDGRDVCKGLKQRAITQKIPVVIVSGSADVEQSAIEAGADDFLAKPFDIQELVNKIKQNTGKKVSDVN